MKWILAKERLVEDRKKTREWKIVSRDGHELGEVRWYAPWRCYVFYPYVGRLFEEDCLRDLAAFCEGQTKEHRRGWKKRRTHA